MGENRTQQTSINQSHRNHSAHQFLFALTCEDSIRTCFRVSSVCHTLSLCSFGHRGTGAPVGGSTCRLWAIQKLVWATKKRISTWIPWISILEETSICHMPHAQHMCFILDHWKVVIHVIFIVLRCDLSQTACRATGDMIGLELEVELVTFNRIHASNTRTSWIGHIKDPCSNRIHAVSESIYATPPGHQ